MHHLFPPPEYDHTPRMTQATGLPYISPLLYSRVNAYTHAYLVPVIYPHDPRRLLLPRRVVAAIHTNGMRHQQPTKAAQPDAAAGMAVAT